MPKVIKIETFIDDKAGREEAERKLSYLVNDGWVIVTAGGGSAASMVWGFVVLQKDDPNAVVQPPDDIQTMY